MAASIIIERARKVFKCTPCQRSFKTEQSLLQHCRATSRHTWCEECRQVFDDVDELQSHLKYAVAHRTCNLCNRVFVNRNNFEMHLITHKVPNIDCVICDREFTTASGMFIHLEAAICIDDQYVKLSFIDFVDSDEGRLLGLEYTEDDMFACKTCSKEFSLASGLFQHIESKACDADESAVTEFRFFLEDQGNWRTGNMWRSW